ncbi:tumor necrosis factor receptor superfamily member 10A-like isoform X1 [Lemur catta]|uniref:tumor necrosis factor receptor superfamily member 10A-like isoform X1 n=1 Tax=Lemur catta TaxID=9447 RepID=UPI001E26CEC5|nr:tumor necrosis factor receptor superfamily member 10A-like isoform X1 [Lemur catta]
MGLAPARRAPRPSLELGARSLLWVKTVVVVGVLLSVSADSVTKNQDRAPQQMTALQQRRHSPKEGLCPPGTHILEGRDCRSCSYGVDYTTHWNALSSCLPCTVCNSDEEPRSNCTTTRNRECQCKPGTFRGEDSPEFCQKCQTRCPDGMVEDRPCTPWSDLVCVHKGSGSGLLAMQIVFGAVVVLLLVVVVVTLLCRKHNCSGCDQDPKFVGRVFSWCWSSPRGPGAEDNVKNEMLNNRDLRPTPVSEKKMEMESQEPADLRGVTILSPREAEHLGPTEAEGSQRRRLLVPANGADPIDTLRLFFDYFPDIVPYESWNPLMRLMGLTDNDIHVARACASSPKDALYEMLVKWVSRTGREASVHTLLEALDALGERCTKETIEDHLVGSGKFIYLDDRAGSAVS